MKVQPKGQAVIRPTGMVANMVYDLITHAARQVEGGLLAWGSASYGAMNVNIRCID